ncbi:MAG TPA: hypothetical protein VF587_02235 [Solirubrobacteraceae bacterium]
MRRLLATAVALLALPTATAHAEPRAFQLFGYDSPLRLTDSTPTVADTAYLANGDTVLLGPNGDVRLLDPKGAVRPLAQLPGDEFEVFASDVDLAPDGSLLVCGAGGLWRVMLDGTTTRLRRGAGPESPSGRVWAADPLPDGTILIVVGSRVIRLAPDGTETVVAGNGDDQDPPRPGPATAADLANPTEVAATPDGGFLVALYDTIWAVDGAGQLRPFAEGLEEIKTMTGDPAGEVLVVSKNGLVALRGGRKTEIVHGDERAKPPYWPVWSGGPLRRAWLELSGGATRTADGGWLVGTDRGVALVTNAAERSERLAVAVEPSTQASAARGSVRVRLTRPATISLRAVSKRRAVARVGRTLEAGTTDVPLPRRLPSGIVEISITAESSDGAVASHTLTVLGTRLLTADAAARSLTAFRQSQTGQNVANAGNCRRRSRTTFSCTMLVGGEDGGFRRRYVVTLRPDGWLYAIAGPVRQRIELIPPYVVN